MLQRLNVIVIPQVVVVAVPLVAILVPLPVLFNAVAVIVSTAVAAVQHLSKVKDLLERVLCLDIAL